MNLNVLCHALERSGKPVSVTTVVGSTYDGVVSHVCDDHVVLAIASGAARVVPYAAIESVLCDPAEVQGHL